MPEYRVSSRDFNFDVAVLSACLGLAVLALALWVGRSPVEDFVALQSLSAGWDPLFWECITTLGDVRVQLALLLPFCLRYPRLLQALLLGALISACFCRGLKLVLPMPRPAAVLETSQILIIGSKLVAHSFPSGHTVSLFAWVLPCLALFGRRAWPVAFLAILAGFSRVAVGAHWPHDVLAGAAIGLLGGWLGWRLSCRWAWQWRGALERLVLVVLTLALASLLVDGQGYPASLPWRVTVCVWALAGVLMPRLWSRLDRAWWGGNGIFSQSEIKA